MWLNRSKPNRLIVSNFKNNTINITSDNSGSSGNYAKYFNILVKNGSTYYYVKNTEDEISLLMKTFYPSPQQAVLSDLETTKV